MIFRKIYTISGTSVLLNSFKLKVREGGQRQCPAEGTRFSAAAGGRTVVRPRPLPGGQTPGARDPLTWVSASLGSPVSPAGADLRRLRGPQCPLTPSWMRPRFLWNVPDGRAVPTGVCGDTADRPPRTPSRSGKWGQQESPFPQQHRLQPGDWAPVPTASGASPGAAGSAGRGQRPTCRPQDDPRG